MADMDFKTAFDKLTSKPPFPWQERLYERFIANDIPKSCILPTGLGKTSVIAIWLIALAKEAKVPRRLVYVVNRRTVVDQTTDEVEKYRNNLKDSELETALRQLYVQKKPPKNEAKEPPEWKSPLALSTLRGQFADNREWSEDPSRPAVICGTVDMIGSRLLFSGYGVGMKAKPLHAGFLGQDALLVHDEAHLEPAFQKLLLAIEAEQKRCSEFQRFHVMELTATRRGNEIPFGITAEDEENDIVRERLHAKKMIRLELLKDTKKVAEQLAAGALEFVDKNRAVIVFTNTVKDVMKIQEILPKGRVVTLTGTMRGKERDELVEKPIFQRFMPRGHSDEPTVFLVCTSAGEVGVNISGDHLICDLSTFDSMAQRFGRVNRFGKRTDTEVRVIHPDDDGFKEDEYDQRRKRTLHLLRELNGDGSPKALGTLDSHAQQAAFSPEPTILPVTDILFDAWALTTIKGKLPGRPMVEPYLHGLPVEWQPPETQVAWREEVDKLAPNSDELEERKALEKLAPTLLEDFPLKPHEILKDKMTRIRETIDALAAKHPDKPAWVISEDDEVRVVTLNELKETEKRDGKTAYKIDSRYCTILLPPSVGGLNDQGMLDANAPSKTKEDKSHEDVSCEWFEDKERTILRRARQEDQKQDDEDKVDDIVIPDGMRLVRCIELPNDGGDDAKPRYWRWYARKGDDDASTTAREQISLTDHTNQVTIALKRIAEKLFANESKIPDLLKLVARLHDLGKDRKIFQAVLGNTNYPKEVLAKSGGKRGHRVSETYRHEFGSLLDALNEAEFQKLSEDEKEFVLHLIATHHGRGRPHFPTDEVFDPKRSLDDAERMAAEVPRRFARLQRKYGRWGLAYLESLLRAADWAASSDPSEFVEEKS